MALCNFWPFNRVAFLVRSITLEHCVLMFKKIPHEKIDDLYFFYFSIFSPISDVFSFKKINIEIYLARYLKMILS